MLPCRVVDLTDILEIEYVDDELSGSLRMEIDVAPAFVRSVLGK